MGKEWSMKDLKAGLEEWFSSDDNSENVYFEDEPGETSKKARLTIDGMYNFNVEVPSLTFHSSDDALEEWIEHMNSWVGRKNPSDVGVVMNEGVRYLGEIGLGTGGDGDNLGDGDEDFEGDGDDDDDFGAFDNDDIYDVAPKKEEKKDEDAIKYTFEQDEEFREYSDRFNTSGASKMAVDRLVKDLKVVYFNGKKFGYKAIPCGTNLFKWEVRLCEFESDTELFQDMKQVKKKTGRDYVELEMTFEQDYPFSPPFIRVVQPRFAFHTGHVTIGGSICMELLTPAGWSAVNDIESVLVQIRSEMTHGGGRIDLSNSTPYTEYEAKEAFNRVARQHGWIK